MSATFSDSDLSAVPIPAINETAEQIASMARDLEDPALAAGLRQAADDFRTQAQPLQQKLLAFRELVGPGDSWLNPLWEDLVLRHRGRLAIESNCALQLRTDTWGESPLTTLIIGLAQLMRHAGLGELEPQKTGNYGSIDKAILQNLAYTRIPLVGRDVKKPAPLSGPMRIGVVHRGRWFIATISEPDGTIVARQSVGQALDYILSEAAKMPVQPPVGVVTAITRDQAASVRARLSAFIENRLNIAALEECVFTVALDSTGGFERFGHDLLIGGAADRWYDKSIQIITDPEERLGLNLERSGADVATWLYVLDLIDKDTALQSGGGGSQTPVHVRPLSWRVDNSLERELDELEYRYAQRASFLNTAHGEIPAINTAVLREINVVPNAFVHTALQTAYFAMSGSVAPSLEEVKADSVPQGGITALRPTNREAVVFAKAFHKGDMEPAEMKRLFRQAEAVYGKRSSLCRKGLGAERHVRALVAMAEMHLDESGQQLPLDVVSNPGWRTLTKNLVHSGWVDSNVVTYCIYGPTEENGMGLGFCMDESSLRLSVSALPKTSVTAAHFFSEAEKTLIAVLELMRDSS